MNSFTKSLLGLLGGILCFATLSVGLTFAVTYKPYGVPDHLREKYDAKVAELEKNQTLARDPEARPRVSVSSKVHDFGMIDPHSTASYAFEVFNKGDSPLELHVVDSSCKCTAGELRQPFVAPGESTKVTLTWNTGYQADSYEQSVLLSTNDPIRKTLTLTVKGVVRSELVAPERIEFKKGDYGKTTSTEFVVYSQLWDDFAVTNAECGLEDFEWVAEPADLNDPSFGDLEPKSAWRVKAWITRREYGKYTDKIKLTITPSDGGEVVERVVNAGGSIRSSINFYSPDIHKYKGLDIGTIVSGERREFHVIVRSRSEDERELAVLDVEPKEIQTELKPLKQPGAYRLTIIIPEDCPNVLFNGEAKHGYIQVGDRENENYNNWFPLLGAVIELTE